MVWFKVDDGFWSHPKVLGLTSDAISLWVRAGSYCAHQLTDGKVTPAGLRMLGDYDAATELVLAGLWEVDSDGAWWFHDWAEYQPTREEVLKERAAATERKRVSRERSRLKSQGESRRDSYGTDAVIPVGVTPTPTRPDPTRPDPSTPSGVEGARALLSPFCSKHPEGIDGPCRACGTARMSYEAARVMERTRPSPRVERPKECTDHPGWPVPCDKCAAIARELAVA